MALDIKKYMTKDQITGSVKNRQAEWANEILQLGISITATKATTPDFDLTDLEAQIALRESWINTAEEELASLFPLIAPDAEATGNANGAEEENLS